MPLHSCVVVCWNINNIKLLFMAFWPWSTSVSPHTTVLGIIQHVTSRVVQLHCRVVVCWNINNIKLLFMAFWPWSTSVSPHTTVLGIIQHVTSRVVPLHCCVVVCWNINTQPHKYDKTSCSFHYKMLKAVWIRLWNDRLHSTPILYSKTPLHRINGASVAGLFISQKYISL